MSVNIINNAGSGAVAEDSIFGYSYSESVTSLHPGDSNGGTGQVSVRAPEIASDKVGNTHPNTKLMINNSVTLSRDNVLNLILLKTSQKMEDFYNVYVLCLVTQTYNQMAPYSRQM